VLFPFPGVPLAFPGVYPFPLGEPVFPHARRFASSPTKYGSEVISPIFPRLPVVVHDGPIRLASEAAEEVLFGVFEELFCEFDPVFPFVLLFVLLFVPVALVVHDWKSGAGDFHASRSAKFLELLLVTPLYFSVSEKMRPLIFSISERIS
jgi:hypothetical protein